MLNREEYSNFNDRYEEAWAELKPSEIVRTLGWSEGAIIRAGVRAWHMAVDAYEVAVAEGRYSGPFTFGEDEPMEVDQALRLMDHWLCEDIRFYEETLLEWRRGRMQDDIDYLDEIS